MMGPGNYVPGHLESYVLAVDILTLPEKWLWPLAQGDISENQFKTKQGH